MVAVENILQNKFGSSKNLPIFAMRNVLKSLDSRTHIIRAVAFHKAEFPLIQSRFGDFGRFAKTSRELRSFVIHINQIFSYQMRNVAKNLTQTPKVCSVSTSNARKSVTSKSVTITPNLLYAEFCRKFLQNKKTLSTFAGQTGLIGYPKDLNITAYKAALLRHFCLISRDLFARLQGRVAFFCALFQNINNNFFFSNANR